MESPKPHGTDVIASLALEIIKNSSLEPTLGRTFDMTAAYKQLALASGSLWASYIAIFNPLARRPEIYQLLAAPFGATRSVYSFLRVAHSIWHLGAAALSFMWTCFFDDYVIFAPSALATSTTQAVTLFFRLLGWAIAEDGSKASDFSECMTSLGINVELTHFQLGCVRFTNTEKRVNELVDCINDFLEKGRMSLPEAQKLRGRMQFADGQLFGRVGSLCMRAVTQHAFEEGAGALKEHCRRALRRFSASLRLAKPRLIRHAAGETWYIFTDACFEPSQESALCGIGGVLINSSGELVSYFSERLSDDQLAALGWGHKRTVIFEAELLALIVAMAVWEPFLKGALVVCYIDNNSARDVAISAAARNACANSLLDKMISVELETGSFFWFARVPSPSNIADKPSRLDTKELEDLGVKRVQAGVCAASVLAEIG